MGWVLVSGAALGAALGALRRERATPAVYSWGIGIAVGAVWLAATGLRPIGLDGIQPVWGVVGALLAFGFSGHLTGYALRDMNLGALTRSMIETLLIRYLRAFGFIFFLILVLLPFYFMVVSSLKPRAELLSDPTYLGIDFRQGFRQLVTGYTEVLVRFDFLRYIRNSTGVALATVVITLTFAVLGAYAVTRLRFPGRDIISRSILLIYMFPAIVLVVPLYVVFTQIGLRDSLPGLLIVYPATTIPVALYMLRSYFQTLPKDLEEAGMIDGCTRFGVIWRITLPLSMPALASVGLYVFMIAWNEFLFAFMFLDTPDIYTLSRGMVALNSQEVPRQFLMAGAVIVTVPIMVLFFWFEKYLIGGLTAGGVKG
jgi:multiple sugar transport system permease protein